MAQWRIDTQGYDQPTVTRFETVMLADQYGNIVIPQGQNGSGTSTFGETLTAPITPVFQLDALYGIQPRDFETYTNDLSGGYAGQDSNKLKFEVYTGDNQYGYGVLRSRRAVRYRPGQGARARFTAMFTATQNNGVWESAAGYIQRAGFFTQEQALQIGFDAPFTPDPEKPWENQFGIMRINGGKAEIVLFDFNGSSTGSAGTLTITLNGIAYPVTLNTTTSLPAQMAEIANEFTGTDKWIVEYGPSKLCFLSRDLGDKTGTHSFTAGATGLSATVTTLQNGVSNPSNRDDYFIPQKDFNLDTLDGNGPSGMVLNPTKLNVFSIDFRWLGSGQIRFAIENPINGDLFDFHHIHYSNANELPHLDNPSLKLGYVAASLGGQSANTVVSGASMMGAIDGIIAPTRLPFGADMDNSTQLTADQYHHLLTIKNRSIYQGKINSREILIKNINSYYSGTNLSATTYLVLDYGDNPSADTELDNLTYESRSETESCVYYSHDVINNVTGFINQLPIYIYSQGGGTTSSLNLDNLRIIIPPGSKLSVFVKGTANIGRSAISMSWVED